MIELSFEQFHDQAYREDGYKLYVLKNGNGDVLYVGISNRNIWERWFGWGGHMTWDGRVIFGESPIGVKVEDHLPESLEWTIQLWTLHDCLALCGDQLNMAASEASISDLEPLMIRKLSPALNGTFNLKPGKDTTHRSKKELERERRADEAYKAIFNKD